MNYLFLSGATDTAKTFVLDSLEMDIQNMGITCIIRQPTSNGDFVSLLQHDIDGRYILINSASDIQASLEDLIHFVDTECTPCNIKLDTIITSLRDSTYPQRQSFLNYFNISLNDAIVDIPMGRPRTGLQRAGSRIFLTHTTLNLIKHILHLSPFNLI